MRLSLEAFAQAKGFTAAQLVRFGVRCTQRGQIIIPYRDERGNEYIRYRIRSSAGDGEGFAWNRGEAPLLPYGLERPVPYAKGAVWVVEGESDCWALWLHEIPALGVPGASNASCLRAEYFGAASTVLVVQEPGEAGSRFPRRIADRLYDDGFAGQVYAVQLPEKDPRALFVSANGSFRQRLLEAYEQRVLVERPYVAAPIAQVQSVSMADVFDTPVEETTWLIDGLLPEGGIGLLAAPPKAGKSVLARNLALAVARGGQFLGRGCRAGMVLWAAFEERRADVVADFKLIGADRTDPIRFYFGSSPSDAVAWLNAECAQNPVRLVILDTWHKFALIENINHYAEVNRANEPLLKLAREQNVAQLWLHHTNKGQQTDGSQVLGSQSIFAACDTLMFLSRAPDGVRSLRTIQRRGDDLEPTVLEMDEEKHIAAAGARYALAFRRAQERILAALAQQGAAVEPRVLQRMTELRRTLFLSALKGLAEVGCVERLGSGRKDDPFRYLGTTTHIPEPLTVFSPNSGSHSSGTLKGTTGTTMSGGSRLLGTPRNIGEPTERTEQAEPLGTSDAVRVRAKEEDRSDWVIQSPEEAELARYLNENLGT